MNEQSDLMQIVCNEDWRKKKPDIFRPVDETIPIYNPSEIYDNPSKYSTVRGIFKYANIDIVEVTVDDNEGVGELDMPTICPYDTKQMTNWKLR